MPNKPVHDMPLQHLYTFPQLPVYKLSENKEILEVIHNYAVDNHENGGHVDKFLEKSKK